MRIALDEINAFLMKQEMFIYLVVFDEASTKLGMSLYPTLEEYIDSNYVDGKSEEEYGGLCSDSVEGIFEYWVRRETVRENLQNLISKHNNRRDGL